MGTKKQNGTELPAWLRERLAAVIDRDHYTARSGPLARALFNNAWAGLGSREKAAYLAMVQTQVVAEAAAINVMLTKMLA